MEEGKKVTILVSLTLNSDGIIKKIEEVKKEQTHLNRALDELDDLLREFELEEKGRKGAEK